MEQFKTGSSRCIGGCDQVDHGDEDDDDDEEYLAAKAKVDLAREKLIDSETRLGTFLLAAPKYTNALGKLLRYEAQIDRSLCRARDQLARLQRDRHEIAAAQATVIDAKQELE